MQSSPTGSDSSSNGGGGGRDRDAHASLSPLGSPLGSPGVILSPQPQHHTTSSFSNHGNHNHTRNGSGNGLHPVNSSSPHLQPPPSSLTHALHQQSQGLHHATPTSRQGTPKLSGLGGHSGGTPRRLSLGNRDALSISGSQESLITYRGQSDDETGQSPKGHPETRKRGWRACKNTNAHHLLKQRCVDSSIDRKESHRLACDSSFLVSARAQGFQLRCPAVSLVANRRSS